MFLKQIILLLSIIIFLIITDILLSKYIRSYRSYKYFKLAEKKAKTSGKKLMVIGDPCQGHSKVLSFITPKLHHGDVTIDLYGCDKCQRSDINDMKFWNSLETDSYVVFETATISFSDNIEKVVKQIHRISGGDFYSGGTTNWLVWRIFIHKLYSDVYGTDIQYIYPPYNPEEDKCFKYKFINSPELNEVPK